MKHLLALFLVLCGCATTPPAATSREEIVANTKRLIAQRERWTRDAYINPQQDKDDGTWRVEVYELGRPLHHGEIAFVPGTRREILFTRHGRLISYHAQTPGT